MPEHSKYPSSLPPDARIIAPDDQPQRYDTLPATATIPVVKTSSRGGTVGLFDATRELVETILPAVLIALLIHLFLAQATRVEGYSMEPTLFGEQRLVIEKLSYRFHEPERGDIVVLRVPGYGRDMLIKRVIGLPGDTIQLQDGQVFLNGQVLDEPYIRTPARGGHAEITIPESKVFVMGDNRNNSNDSRSFGAIPLEDIVGRAWLRYWPLTESGIVD